jgi:membrane-associated phospholipid phosphatase
VTLGAVRVRSAAMQARIRSINARLLPRGWSDLARQMLLFGVAFFLYDLVRGLADGRDVAAFQHARTLISVERALHVFVEPSIQAWASGSHVVMVIATWLYLNAQTTVLIAALTYIYFRHNRSFYFVRNMLLIAMAIALVAYLLFPTAPPRFLPEWGFVDTVSDITGVSPTKSVPNVFFNPYAAIPSMHVGFALMMGWPLARLVRSRVLRWFWMLYPLLMLFVIVATANHFLLDAVLGGLTAGVSAYAADRLARRRPHAWRFSPAPKVAGAA